MEPTENQKISIDSRAKEIDTGAIPLSMSNVILGLPVKPEPPVLSDSVSARPWTWAELVSQKQLVTTIAISPSTKEDVPLWEYNNSWRSIINSKFFMSEIGELYVIRRWDLNLLFEFRSNFQQVGMMSLVHSNCPPALEGYFFPSSRTASIHDFAIQTQLPHRLIPMGEDVDVSVCLKWNASYLSSFERKYYSMDWLQNTEYHQEQDDYQMGILRLYAPFKMETSNGVDNQMTVRIWAYLTNLQYAAYAPIDRAFKIG